MSSLNQSNRKKIADKAKREVLANNIKWILLLVGVMTLSAWWAQGFEQALIGGAALFAVLVAPSLFMYYKK